MKPSDYKYPFKSGDYRVLLKDGAFFVPLFREKEDPFVFPGWNAAAVFGNKNKVFVEYCSGNGAWIASKALENKEINWVAVERKFDRVQKIISKRVNHNLNNLLVLCGEGYNATQKYFPSKSIEEIFVNFPDPWPKKRHWKNRIINQEMIKEFHRILSEKGVTTFVTDDDEYARVMVEEMIASKLFSPLFKDPYYVEELQGYGNSYFEELWRSQGKKIKYIRFERING